MAVHPLLEFVFAFRSAEQSAAKLRLMRQTLKLKLAMLRLLEYPLQEFPDENMFRLMYSTEMQNRIRGAFGEVG
jgi:hypothetical protein